MNDATINIPEEDGSNLSKRHLIAQQLPPIQTTQPGAEAAMSTMLRQRSSNEPDITVVSTPPNDDDAISDLDQVEAEFLQAKLAQQNKKVLSYAFTIVKFLFRMVILFLIGALITISPFIVALMIKNPLLAQELKFWSIWATTLWACLIFTFTLVKFLRRAGSDNSRLGNSLKVYQYYGAVVVSMTLSLIMVDVLKAAFPPAIASGEDAKSGDIIAAISVYASARDIGRRIIISILAISVVLFLQKLFMFFTAWQYYQVAYKEKERKKVFTLTTLHHLESAKRDDTYVRREFNHKINGPKSPMISVNSPPSPMPDPTGYRPGLNYISPYPSDDEYNTYGYRANDTPKHQKRQRTVRARKTIKNNNNSTFFGSFSLKNKVKDPSAKYSENAARKRAKYIYHRLAQSSKRTRELELEDFLPYYEGDETAAMAAMALFDEDDNGSVTYKEVTEAVISIYQDCVDLASSKKNLARVLARLDSSFFGLSALIGAIALLAIWVEDPLRVLVPCSTLLGCVTFAFSSTARNLFESVVFVFSTHAFDVGDRVFVDQQNLLVREITILTSIFERADGQLIYIPNVVLQGMQLANIRRSPPQNELIEVHIAFDTPGKKIIALENAMNHYLAMNPRDFAGPELYIQVFDVENVNRVKLSMYLEHKSNWQDVKKRWQRRSKFVWALRDAMADLEIVYSLPPARHDVYYGATRPPRSDEDLAALAPNMIQTVRQGMAMISDESKKNA